MIDIDFKLTGFVELATILLSSLQISDFYNVP